MTVLCCEKCKSEFKVPADKLIGGRKVRCADCRHVWFQKDPAEEKPKTSETGSLNDFADALEKELEQMSAESLPDSVKPDVEAVEKAEAKLVDEPVEKPEDEKTAGKKIRFSYFVLMSSLSGLIVILMFLIIECGGVMSMIHGTAGLYETCLLYTSPSPRD